MKWGWDYNRDLRSPEVVSERVFGIGEEPTVRINMHKAMNGMVLEIITFGPRNNGFDMLIVAEGESLHDIVATQLLARSIK